jgi:hypothetical protein
VVEFEGARFFNHKEKERFFTYYYHKILGSTSVTHPLIELREVYPTQLDLSSLSDPFTMQEIHSARKQIPQDKRPGPDVFGSGFYQDFWNLVSSNIINIFNEFSTGQAQIAWGNRSYIVLIKKKDNACTPDEYRPISLLNLPVKLITKVLAIGLQSTLHKLIDNDQMCFVQTRCIADNFIYAVDLVQSCNQMIAIK